jgi:methylmalonyl-CoA/ethylmalonyl-CoA epimerase
VDDINVALKEVLNAGLRSTSPTPKIGAHGKPVVFLHPVDTDGCLIELEQA